MKFKITYPTMPYFPEHEFIEEIIEAESEEEAYKVALESSGIYDIVSSEEIE